MNLLFLARCGAKAWLRMSALSAASVPSSRKASTVSAGVIVFVMLFSSGIAAAQTPERVPLRDVVQVAVGNYHTCALRADGAVKCWGSNVGGLLGNGRSGSRELSPVSVVGLGGPVTSISAGIGHTCALTSKGGVKCWGGFNGGVLGIGVFDGGPYTVPEDVVGLASGVVAISAGKVHTCALTSAGGVKCWGGNADGELGDGTYERRAMPVDVQGLGSGVVAISSGGATGSGSAIFGSHTCALMDTGSVKCWGYNSDGQLGDGTRYRRLAPVDVLDAGGFALEGMTSVTAGAYHTCARTDDADAICWGYNGWGELGDGSEEDDRLVPDEVSGLDGMVAAVMARGMRTCALTTAGAMKCWGRNDFGQLGEGTLDGFRHALPVDVPGLDEGVASLGMSNSTTCAVLQSGGLKCWGQNLEGNLGLGFVPFLTYPAPMMVPMLQDGVATVSVGLRTACVGMADATVKCWGSLDSVGVDVGLPTLSGSTDVPTVIDALGSDEKQVSVGLIHACAVTSAGGVKCWGDNEYGQLGEGSLTDRELPRDVVGLTTGAIAVSAGDWHTCALTAGGGVKCWGRNDAGQLGDGSVTRRITPVDVIGLHAGVKEVSAAGQGFAGAHTCVLTDAGGVKCWGDNRYGQLGLGVTDLEPHPEPSDVPGLESGVVAISAGNEHTCVQRSNGSMACWGRNNVGQIGDGTTALRAVPTDVQGLPSSVAAISAGGDHTCAVTTAGAMLCWGNNVEGKLGIDRLNVGSGWGEADPYPIPQQVVGLGSGVTAIDASFVHTCAVVDDGTLMCWGGNGLGLGVAKPVDLAGSRFVVEIFSGDFESAAPAAFKDGD